MAAKALVIMSASEDEQSPVEDDLEVIQEPENTEAVEPNPNQEDEAEVAAESENKEVKVKRVRNPQPKLNVDRLKGPRGLQMIETVFKDVKFQGQGHEENDLSVLMKSYEYWCHRLFPKFPFDASLERMEKLGNKKPLQTYLKRIRMDLVLDDEIVEAPEVDEDQAEVATVPDAFDDLLTPQATVATEINEEQLERIRINRERAQRLRQQMLIRTRASSDFDSNISMDVESQN